MAYRFKKRLTREKITRLNLNGLKHQMEFLRHKVKKTYHIRVYYLESGEGVDDEIEVSQEIYEDLHSEPLTFYFSFNQGKLVPLSIFLHRLNLSIICQVKLFISKLKLKVMLAKRLIAFRKEEVEANYSDSLRYIIFIT